MLTSSQDSSLTDLIDPEECSYQDFLTFISRNEYLEDEHAVCLTADVTQERT